MSLISPPCSLWLSTKAKWTRSGREWSRTKMDSVRRTWLVRMNFSRLCNGTWASWAVSRRTLALASFRDGGTGAPLARS